MVGTVNNCAGYPVPTLYRRIVLRMIPLSLALCLFVSSLSGSAQAGNYNHAHSKSQAQAKAPVTKPKTPEQMMKMLDDLEQGKTPPGTSMSGARSMRGNYGSRGYMRPQRMSSGRSSITFGHIGMPTMRQMAPGGGSSQAMLQSLQEKIRAMRQGGGAAGAPAFLQMLQGGMPGGMQEGGEEGGAEGGAAGANAAQQAQFMQLLQRMQSAQAARAGSGGMGNGPGGMRNMLAAPAAPSAPVAPGTFNAPISHTNLLKQAHSSKVDLSSLGSPEMPEQYGARPRRGFLGQFGNARPLPGSGAQLPGKTSTMQGGGSSKQAAGNSPQDLEKQMEELYGR